MEINGIYVEINVKKKFAKDLIFLSAITLATVCIWVALQGYHRLNDEYVKKLSEEAVDFKPIDPKLPIEVLEEIKKKKEYSLTETREILASEITTEESEIASFSGER